MGNRFTTQVIKKDYGLNPEKPISVIIPAAGMGYRMKSYGPTCLLNANKKQTLIQKTIDNIKKVLPYSDIIIVLGFESEKVIKNLPRHVRIVENNSYEETNIVESLRLGINNSVTENALIIDGDLIFNINTIKGITSLGSSCVLIDSKDILKSDKVGVTVVENRVTSFSFGLDKKWGKIAYLQGKEFKMFHKLCCDRKKNKMFTFELFNIMINNGCDIKPFEPSGYMIKEVDSLKDLQ
tara:strand:+ start:1079 stop:1792 length:714 start_codon:yes stop_codon:yes gene_type:complete